MGGRNIGFCHLDSVVCDADRLDRGAIHHTDGRFLAVPAYVLVLEHTGVHAGWQFLAYFAAYSALYYFVGVYEPKLYRSQQNGKRNG
jgi:hypothetical protein